MMIFAINTVCTATNYILKTQIMFLAPNISILVSKKSFSRFLDQKRILSVRKWDT